MKRRDFLAGLTALPFVGCLFGNHVFANSPKDSEFPVYFYGDGRKRASSISRIHLRTYHRYGEGYPFREEDKELSINRVFLQYFTRLLNDPRRNGWGEWCNCSWNDFSQRKLTLHDAYRQDYEICPVFYVTRAAMLSKHFSPHSEERWDEWVLFVESAYSERQLSFSYDAKNCDSLEDIHGNGRIVDMNNVTSRYTYYPVHYLESNVFKMDMRAHFIDVLGVESQFNYGLDGIGECAPSVLEQRLLNGRHWASVPVCV